MTEDRLSKTLPFVFRCLACEGAAATPISDYENFSRVTSDCKPWPKWGRLLLCDSCGSLQKAVDRTWQDEIESIYSAYSIYHQSAGVEQAVFEQASGCAASRSARLLEHLKARIKLPETGRLLDVGCGNGALLRAFSRLEPTWSLTGTELSEKYRAEVEKIPGVESLQTCSPEHVTGEFNLITMVHVLEHIPDPVGFLQKVSDKLADDGLLVIEVPDYLRNPFDLLITDHSTHYTMETLGYVIRKAGLDVVLMTGDWISKELTVIARKIQAARPGPTQAQASPLSLVTARVHWLRELVATAKRLSITSPFGIFGTSIAATWLFGQLEKPPAFFVDEDMSRVGRTYMGIPVYHPTLIPSGSHVFIPMPADHGHGLKIRLETVVNDVNFSLGATLPA